MKHCNVTNSLTVLYMEITPGNLLINVPAYTVAYSNCMCAQTAQGQVRLSSYKFPSLGSTNTEINVPLSHTGCTLDSDSLLIAYIYI